MDSDECPDYLVPHLEFFGYYREQIIQSPDQFKRLLEEWQRDLDLHRIKPADCPISIYTLSMPGEMMRVLPELGYDPYHITINGHATHQELHDLSQWVSLLTLGYNLFTRGHEQVVREEVLVGINMPPRQGHNHYTYLTNVIEFMILIGAKINVTIALISLVVTIVTSDNLSIEILTHLIRLLPWALHYSVGRALGQTLDSFESLQPYITLIRSLRLSSDPKYRAISICPSCSQLLLILQLGLIRSRQWHTICRELQCLPPRGSFPGGSHYHAAHAHFSQHQVQSS